MPVVDVACVGGGRPLVVGTVVAVVAVALVAAAVVAVAAAGAACAVWPGTVGTGKGKGIVGPGSG
jgi:hypothetical protein